MHRLESKTTVWLQSGETQPWQAPPPRRASTYVVSRRSFGAALRQLSPPPCLCSYGERTWSSWGELHSSPPPCLHSQGAGGRTWSKTGEFCKLLPCCFTKQYFNFGGVLLFSTTFSSAVARDCTSSSGEFLQFSTTFSSAVANSTVSSSGEFTCSPPPQLWRSLWRSQGLQPVFGSSPSVAFGGDGMDSGLWPSRHHDCGRAYASLHLFQGESGKP